MEGTDAIGFVSWTPGRREDGRSVGIERRTTVALDFVSRISNAIHAFVPQRGTRKNRAYAILAINRTETTAPNPDSTRSTQKRNLNSSSMFAFWERPENGLLCSKISQKP